MLEINPLMTSVPPLACGPADGESTWFEGVQLLGVYTLLGVVYYYA